MVALKEALAVSRFNRGLSQKGGVVFFCGRLPNTHYGYKNSGLKLIKPIARQVIQQVKCVLNCLGWVVYFRYFLGVLA